MFILSVLGKENGNWELLDESNYTVKEFYSRFEEFRVVLSDEENGDRFEVRSEDYRNVVDVNDTELLLNALERDRESLIPKSVTMLSQIQRVISKDLYEYPVEISLGLNTMSGGQIVPTTMKKDLKITSKIKGVTLGLEVDCLISVNGTIYPTVLIDDILFIKNAAWELSGGRSATITVLDFSEVGGLDKVRINKHNLKSRRTLGADQLYLSMCIIDVGQDMTGKQVFSVEAGFLELDNISIERFGPTTIKMQIVNEVAIKRILKRPISQRSNYQEDLSGRTLIKKLNFRPDRYLTQEDSMICILKDPKVCKHSEDLINNGIENEYSFYRHIEGIAINEDGEIINYKCVPTENRNYLIRGQEQNRDVFMESVNSEGEDIVTKVKNSKSRHEPKHAKVFDLYRLN